MHARALLAALALGLAAAGSAGARADAVSVAPRTDLDRLVRLLVPDDAMADLAQRAFDHRAQGAAGGVDAQALYRRYPGLQAQVTARVRPQLLRIMRRELPALRREIGAIIAAQMTPSEIAASSAFFASPTGRKVYARALRAIGDRPDRTQAEATQAAMAAVVGNLAPRDYPAVLRFSASGAAAKMARVNPRVAAAQPRLGPNA